MLSYNHLVYCTFDTNIFRTIDEQEVANHSFDLIFAFDEIVALGYRESVNLAQIRTFTEMDSHEEKVSTVYYSHMRLSDDDIHALTRLFRYGLQCEKLR